MSKKNLTELVAELQGKSMTFGWDALTLYDKRKANELLFQLYVDRFNSEDGYIKPASMIASWGDGSYKEHIFELKLSAPRLSFENSDPSINAVARLTMDMVGGMIVSTKQLGGVGFVSKMLQVLPVGGPQLWMEQPVTKAVVSGLGDVVIDIRNANTFKANFVMGDLAQDDIGKRFREFFELEVSPKQKFFPLGRLQGDLNGALTPKNFEVRTMKSDRLAVLGDENYGDGAVMLFITLKDGKDGGSPNSNSLYLIPADEGGTKYTGAMLLSSRVLFDKIMRGPAKADIGFDLEFLEYTDENGGAQDIAWSLKGSSGGIEHKFSHPYKVRSEDFDAVFEVDLSCFFKQDNGGVPLTVKAGTERIEFFWRKQYSPQWSRVIYGWEWDGGDTWDHGPLDFMFDFKVSFDVVLDKQSGAVSFQRNAESSNFDLRVTGFEHLFDMKWEGQNIPPKVEEFLRPRLYEMLAELSTPTLDTFLLRNLLFPGHNALHLSDAFVPGDLAVFGQIDPLRTSTVLAPANSMIEAGSKLQFTLTPMPTNIQWSVKDVDGKLAEPGTISSTGEYTAPTADKLSDGFVAALVTAKGMLNGQPVESSALVSVLHSAIVANPMYDSCDPGDDKQLTAEAVNGETLEWEILTKQWGSTLTPVAGEPTRRTYKAGGSEDPAIPFSVDKIQIKKTTSGVTTYAYIHILIHNQSILLPMLMSENSDPTTGTVQFELRDKHGKPIDPEALIWKLLSGEGTFNEKTGVYTEPSSSTPGSFIVVSATLEGPVIDAHAVAAVPLPLRKYAELIEVVNLTLAAD